MKTIKNLTVTVTYTVGLEDIEVPEDSIAAEWLANNIVEKDAVNWSYEIDDLE